VIRLTWNVRHYIRDQQLQKLLLRSFWGRFNYWRANNVWLSRDSCDFWHFQVAYWSRHLDFFKVAYGFWKYLSRQIFWVITRPCTLHQIFDRRDPVDVERPIYMLNFALNINNSLIISHILCIILCCYVPQQNFPYSLRRARLIFNIIIISHKLTYKILLSMLSSILLLIFLRIYI